VANPYSPPAETPAAPRFNRGLIAANLIAAILPTVYFIAIFLIPNLDPYLGYAVNDWNDGRLTNPRILFTLVCNLFASGPFLLGAFDLAVLKAGRRATPWQWASFFILLGSMGLQMAVLWSDQFNGSRGFGIIAAATIYFVVTTPAMWAGSIWRD